MLIIASPLAGRTALLDAVPDPVFAERMMGDGVAIQPLDGTVHAPFDGEIITVHEAGHAVALRSSEGVEVLIHIGLDTVALKGRGFTPLVAVGQAVACGDPLIRFDLDAVALAATSLITPVIVTNSEAFTIVRRAVGAMVGVGEELMALVPVGTATGTAIQPDEGSVVTRTVTVSLPDGLHARPAARISLCARRFGAELHLLHGDRRADARSTVALLALGARHGAELIVEARGPDANSAIAEVIQLLAGTGAERTHPRPAPAPAPATSLEPGQIGGITASPGLAIGPATWLREARIEVFRDGADPATERSALAAATGVLRERIGARARSDDQTVAGIMSAHLALLDDPQIRTEAEAAIESGASAAFAWRSAVRAQVDLLLQTGDDRLIERSADLIDIERQILSILAGGANEEETAAPPGAILVADDLLPSQLVTLALSKPAGVCLARGGPTSHVAILCAGMGIPALVAIGEPLAGIADGTTLLLDADASRVTPAPTADATQAFAARIADRHARRAAALAGAGEPCRTADGTRIAFQANVGSIEEAATAARNGAEGSGLVRSEFLFLGRNDPPSENEQHAAYQRIADAFEGRPVLVRLLDIGGDKPAAYLPFAVEENPALGLRGIRVGLAFPGLLETQIRAILRVRPALQCRIMVPMVTGVAEFRAVRTIVDRVADELGIGDRVEVGVMVETPAAAATADLLCREADFLSIGTNDLTQYTLAMDRGNPAVAAGVDAMHPAVLRLIAETCRLAAVSGRPVGVCGGLASDPAALPILIGLGVTRLSSVPGFVAEGKAIVRGLTLTDARAHSAQALQCSSSAEVRSLARAFGDITR